MADHLNHPYRRLMAEQPSGQTQPANPLAVQSPVAATEYVRPTQVARPRNNVLINLAWLPVAAVVGIRALADPRLSTAWIAAAVSMAAVWLATDAIGTRMLNRFVIAHDRIDVRFHDALRLIELEVTADSGVEMDFRIEGSRLRRQHVIDLCWPSDEPCHTIRIDTFSRSDQAKIVRRLTELTTRR